MYVCGGWTGKATTNEVERYSLKSKKWEEISPMQERRCAHAVLAFDDRIYAIGGSGPNKVFSNTVCQIFIDYTRI